MRERQFIASGLVLAVTIVLAIAKAGPFGGTIPVPTGTTGLLDQLLRERFTLGLVRLGLIALALFIILSVPALMIAGRWLKGFGKEGLTADDAQDAGNTIEEMQVQIEELTEQKDLFAQRAKEAEGLLLAMAESYAQTVAFVVAEAAVSSGEEVAEDA